MSVTDRKKIVILGGGVGAMTTAVYLTNPSDWQERYDITVYQLGWRLGGKGASGRGQHSRIEEHGLHMWYGFYENAFRLIRHCYQDLARPLGEPLSTWEEAFKPQNFTVYQENVDGRWLHWPINLPTNDATPGDGDVFPGVSDYVTLMLEWMVEAFRESIQPEGPPPAAAVPASLKLLPWWQRLIDDVEREGKEATRNVGVLLLTVAHRLARNPQKYDPFLPGPTHDTIHWLLEHFASWLHDYWGEYLGHHDDLRRLWIMMDLVGSTVRGLIADKAISHGFAAINDKDFAEWLAQHGADPIYTIPFVHRNLYDQAFAYIDGDINKPSFAAGVVVYTASRTYFTYKGAFLWEMQAGMGDTIFAPMYQLLQRRGVKFEFFHRVDSLHVANAGISGVTLARQVNLKNGTYDPLIKVKGLPCWPSEPLYDQIVEGEQLKAEGIDLESYWTPWEDVGRVELQASRGDFDLVVLAISLGALPAICRELIDVNQQWRDMVAHVKTNQTQAFQLWLKPDSAGLGWPMWRQQAATLTGYDADTVPERAGLDTWADMSHLIIREEWPGDYFPNNIAYFCGAMKGPGGLHLPLRSDRDFPRRQAEQVRQNALYFLKHYVQHLWPRATLSQNPDELNWDLLVDPTNSAGEQRFDSQFWRANVDPSERYVLCAAGSVSYRLKPGLAGFDNLYPAGDWVDNGLLSLGCVESAVIGGMQAANAILQQFGYLPIEIIGSASLGIGSSAARASSAS